MLVRVTPNTTLKGHKILFLVPYAVPQDYLDELKSSFPDLKIVVEPLSWAVKVPPTTLSPDDWKDTTILLTGSALPTRDVAPKLEYVQLISAGANHIVSNPLFTDTEIAFCTANGVHGYRFYFFVLFFEAD
jgi:hypothetical protein